MSIEERLRKDLTAAIKARDSLKANTIRMLNTKVMERRTAKGFTGKVDDALHLEVIAAYRKSMEKAQEQFRAAGDRGAQQVADLQFELDYCAQFLPQKLGDDQVRELVRVAIAETGVTDVKQIGRVVGAVMKTHKGEVEPDDVKRIAAGELA